MAQVLKSLSLHPAPLPHSPVAEGEVTDGICVDFSTAFDSVPHDLLIKPKINRPPPHSLDVARGRPALEFASETYWRPSLSLGLPRVGCQADPGDRTLVFLWASRGTSEKFLGVSGERGAGLPRGAGLGDMVSWGLCRRRPASSLSLESALGWRSAQSGAQIWRNIALWEADAAGSWGDAGEEGTPATSSLYFIRCIIKGVGSNEGRETYPCPVGMADLSRNFSSPGSGEAVPDRPRSLRGVQEWLLLFGHQVV